MAPREALVVLYQAMLSESHPRICMVFEIAGEPSVFLSLLTRYKSNTVTILKLIIVLSKTKLQHPRTHPRAGRLCVRLGVSV